MLAGIKSWEHFCRALDLLGVRPSWERSYIYMQGYMHTHTYVHQELRAGERKSAGGQ